MNVLFIAEGRHKHMHILHEKNIILRSQVHAGLAAHAWLNKMLKTVPLQLNNTSAILMTKIAL